MKRENRPICADEKPLYDVVCLKCIVLDSDYSNLAVAQELSRVLALCPWPVTVRWDDGSREARVSREMDEERLRAELRAIRSGL